MQKLYYSISEVSKIIDEEQHILRYWEKEFSQIKPRKNRAGNRVYSLRDLSILKAVKTLLRDEKLTLKVAKDKINSIEFADLGDSTSVDNDFLTDSSVEKQAVGVVSEKVENVVSSVNENNKSLSYSDLKELKELLTDIKNVLSN
jgi:DNA-binding transcriptional MerR regulator